MCLYSFFVDFQVLFDLAQQARLESVAVDACSRQRLPLAGNQNLRFDERIERFLQFVAFDFLFHTHSFIYDPNQPVARDAVFIVNNR